MIDMTYISNRIQCSDTEKLRVFQTVKKLYDYALCARREGLLFFEYNSEKESDPFLKTCMMFIADAMEPDWFREYLLSHIISADVTGERFLEMVVIADASLSIQKGEYPSHMLFRLSEWFGEDFQHYFDEEFHVRTIQ